MSPPGEAPPGARQRSVVSILTIGIGTLVAVFALAALSAALQTRSLAHDTEALTGPVSRARTAMFEMENDAGELASATRAYLATGDGGAERRIAEARRGLVRYQRLLRDTRIAGAEERRLREPLRRFAQEADTLVELGRRQRSAIRAARARLAAMDSLLTGPAPQGPRTPAAARARAELEIALARTTARLWAQLAGQDTAGGAPLAADRPGFARALEGYRAAPLAPAEAAAASELAALHGDYDRRAAEVRRLGAELAVAERRFVLAEREVERVLNSEIQPRVEEYRAATAQRARQASRRAAAWAVAGLLTASLLGGIVAVATLRAVSRPLHILTRAAERIREGRFDHPVGRLPTAEFDRLAASFDRMAGDLATARAELERARDGAEAASLRKTEFVSEVSHELRTPLTAIRASLGLLAQASGGALAPAPARLVELARRNSDRLASLIDDMLDLDRIEAGADELHPVRVAPPLLVHAALEATRPRADERGVGLRETHADAEPVRGDPDRLERVLINLIANAVKYAPPGSEVRVGTHPIPGGCRFEVEDGGPGIPEAHQPRIFQRFARAGGSADPGGTGLGLALARAIVERHGGRIGFESRPGLTRFWFELPAEGAAAAR